MDWWVWSISRPSRDVTWSHPPSPISKRDVQLFVCNRPPNNLWPVDIIWQFWHGFGTVFCVSQASFQGSWKMGRWTIFYIFAYFRCSRCAKPLDLCLNSLLSWCLDALLQQLQGTFLLCCVRCAWCTVFDYLHVCYNQFEVLHGSDLLLRHCAPLD